MLYSIPHSVLDLDANFGIFEHIIFSIWARPAGTWASSQQQHQ